MTGRVQSTVKRTVGVFFVDAAGRFRTGRAAGFAATAAAGAFATAAAAGFAYTSIFYKCPKIQRKIKTSGKVRSSRVARTDTAAGAPAIPLPIRAPF